MTEQMIQIAKARRGLVRALRRADRLEDQGCETGGPTMLEAARDVQFALDVYYLVGGRGSRLLDR